MGYRIVYGPERQIASKTRRTTGIRTMIAISFGLFSLLVRLFWPEGREVLMTYLQPGQESVTQIAFSQLMGNLHQGTAIADALTVFCKEILYEIA